MAMQQVVAQAPPDIAQQLSHGKAVFRPGRAWLPYERIALVLQGGGALGAYQAGVFEGLAERGIHPGWVAGISIGALNAAIIAGNAPADRVDRLRQFWRTICRPGFFMATPKVVQSMVEQWEGDLRRAANGFEALRAAIEGQNGFFHPRGWIPLPGIRMPPDKLSFYDTQAMKSTLERFVDFDRLNSGEMRVSVSAVNVATGNVQIFDTRDRKLRAEHFMASAALPPGLPAIEIDGAYYWDGGLVTNTPLFPVLLERPRVDTIVFQVDLFSARGQLPQDLIEAEARRKDIMFSSRTRMATQYLQEVSHQRRLMRELLELIPEAQRRDNEWCRQAAEESMVSQYNVIHLIYQGKSYEGAAREFEFSAVTMRDHWASGLRDIRHTCQHPDWFDLPPHGAEYVTHDVHRPRTKGR
ncbi:MAG: patatin-like phospholipase family protein [Burkholderiaceae bacterium]